MACASYSPCLISKLLDPMSISTSTKNTTVHAYISPHLPASRLGHIFRLRVPTVSFTECNFHREQSKYEAMVLIQTHATTIVHLSFGAVCADSAILHRNVHFPTLPLSRCCHINVRPSEKKIEQPAKYGDTTESIANRRCHLTVRDGQLPRPMRSDRERRNILPSSIARMLLALCFPLPYNIRCT
jgi:hypothetical protein